MNVTLSPDYRPLAKEPFMNKKMQEFFRQKLLDWKVELLDESNSTILHLQEGGNVESDLSDRASVETERSLELRTRDRERKLIKKIDQTIDRIDKDDYGFCDQCGVEIGIRRLEARPTAALCIDCKTLAEIRERQTGI